MSVRNILYLSVLPFLLVCFLVLDVGAASRPNVVFLNPGSEEDAFFGMMTSFMRAAADDLGIDLEIVSSGRDHLKMRELGWRILDRKTLPEYLILVNEKNGVVDILPRAAQLGIKVVLINEGLLPQDQKRLGKPGDLISNWLFQLMPDDKQAGFLLGRALIEEAVVRGLVDDTKVVHVTGISGTYQTGSSSLRVLGLEQAVKEYGNARLEQVVPAYWDEMKAEAVTAALLQRYPETGVVWAASDVMARGVLKASEESDSFHGSVVTGGIDWAEFALHEVKDGRFAATVGGHFMDGGWALVLLYDLHNGAVLKDRSMMSRFSLITAENVDTYLKYFGEHDWSVIDFRKFSKILNPERQDYGFGLESVMTQLQAR